MSKHLLIDAGPGCGKSSTMVSTINIILGNKVKGFTPTAEQEAIYGWVKKTVGTNVWACNVAAMAFNKSIATELAEKVPDGVDARTFHSFGMQVLRANGYKFKASAQNVSFILKDLMGYSKDDRMSREHFELSQIVSKFVGLIKNNLLEVTHETMVELAKVHNIEVNGNIEEITELTDKVIKKNLSIKPGEFAWIDFDDMIWLPIAKPDMKFGKVRKQLLISDESQDLNPVQQELVLRAAEHLVVVGDPRQSIYAFRGADVRSMETMKERLDEMGGCDTLPLQVSFRLPKSGVANVQNYAPNLRALPNAIEGEIEECYVDEMQTRKTPLGVGDLVVSRVNANGFSLGFKLLQQRVPVRIQGRDFGSQIVKIIKDNCPDDGTIEDALLGLRTYDTNERERIEKKMFAEKLLDLHGEKMHCLFALTEGCKTVREMIEVVETLFDETMPRSKCVTISTVHRAKGLEADHVWILEPSLIPHPMAKTESEIAQEYNIKFVAETRHKKRLVYVHARPDEDERDIEW